MTNRYQIPQNTERGKLALQEYLKRVTLKFPSNNSYKGITGAHGAVNNVSGQLHDAAAAMTQTNKIRNDSYRDCTILGNGFTQVIRVGIGATENIVIKRLNPNHLNDEERFSSFQQEIEITDKIKHPNVVRVLDRRIEQNGAPLMIMEFMHGVTLANYLCGRETVALQELLEIFLQILDALTHIHGQDIIHLDIKPENVFLVEQSPQPVKVKLMDFGISHYLDKRTKECFSEIPRFAGTPLYMSPEQCSRSELTFASDIYSMGCLMYESLTGLPPFQGDSGFATMYKHLRQPVAAFAEACPRNPLPNWLEKIVLRSLSKNPKERYNSAAAMQRELQLEMMANAPMSTQLKRVINRQTCPTLYDNMAAITHRSIAEKTLA